MKNIIKNNIAIIVPIYKGEQTLKRCVDSIINQEGVNTTIYLVVQKSPDSSLSIASNYKNHHNNIRVIETPENAGVSYNRNQALEIVDDEFVTFIDCDDAFHSNMSLRTMLDNHSCDSLVSGNRYIVKNDVPSKIYNDFMDGKSYELNSIFYNNEYRDKLVSSLRAKLFDIKIISKYNIRFINNLNLGEDNIFILDYLTHIKTVSFIKEVITNDYVDNLDSLTRKHSINKDLEYEKFYQTIKDRYHENWNQILYELCFCYYNQFFMLEKKDIVSEIGFFGFYKKIKRFKKTFWNSLLKNQKKSIKTRRKVFFTLPTSFFVFISYLLCNS